ncbi:amidohydrolase [Salsipaludibacter albus]|uniref:amidohydrolase n=1 Tax=Salsipaludibacter albus TaxID=2849650 RepID=UPI001EE3A32E|nr:amidohydrolase [Salsipaludibacter albus]
MATSPADGEPDGPGARGVLLTADRVVTLGHGRYQARALLVRGTRVVWVGDDPDLAPPHARRIDLDGCVIGPSFVDSHVHLTPTGISLLGLDLSGVRSPDELLRAVRLHAEQDTGRVIWGHGWDDHDWDQPLPTPEQLHEASGGRPVTLARIDSHSSLVDTSTLRSAPLTRTGGIERDADGRPTGRLRRDANKVARRWAVGAMSEADLDRARAEAVRFAVSRGVGTVHEMGGPDAMGETDFDAWCEGDWGLEVVPYWGATDLSFALDRDLRHVGGDIWLDGSLGSHTAALTQPYADHPGSGDLEYADATLVELFTEATHAGMQVAVHAIGDAAIDQAIRCWHRVVADLPEHLADAVRRLRHRIEHGEVVRPDQLDDLVELGIVLSAQPAFETLWGGPGGLYEQRLGPHRATTTNPYRALADRGVPLAFGSDANVTPIAPWEMVWAAEHRHRHRHEITRLEAVSASTLGGRHAARQERWVGVLRAGMRADLTAWEGDPYEADDPRGASCVLTVVKGRVVHGDLDLG